MPPKPRMVRKASVAAQPPDRDVQEPWASQAAKNKSLPKISTTAKMLPPPPPPPPQPTTILGGEMQALEGSLKEAARHTGRVFRFYSDTKKERIKSHAPYPPRSITRSLGRSLERYDQICDTIETQLQLAISVLERDLEAEQARLKAEALASNTRSKRPSPPPSATLPDGSPPPGLDQIPLTESPTSTVASSHFPLPSGASATSIVPRRPSAILSSLHRPGFPLKLDLSAAALANVNVDLGLTALPSPVTLAPKTARALPNDASLPDIFAIDPSQSLPQDGSAQSDSGSLAGPVTEIIDLTESETGPAPQLGDSADKPIELDLEGSYDDLFGDVQASQGEAIPGNNTGSNPDATQLDVDMEGLFTPQDDQNTFQLDQSHGTSEAPDARSILASIAANTNSGESSNVMPSLMPSDDSQAVPSQPLGDTFPNLGGDSGTETQFDLSGLDLTNFTGFFEPPGDSGGEGHVDAQDEMELMSQLLAMDGVNNANPSAGSGQ
ncbi:hypothetical protein BU17DRAFT_42183 [Hysterangium stoloniferum]|nr:hypothetical protein BU17DRAFT_42183 [Hysterangium stoloniferum]